MKIAAVVGILFGLLGCKPNADKAISLVEKEVASHLKDPESAKFRNTKYIKTKVDQDGYSVGTVCGEYNAKNGFGAYAGYTGFMADVKMKAKGVFSSGVTYSIDGLTMVNGNDRLASQIYEELCQQ